jgi:type II secretory pathway pseudopilin PulG
MIELIAVLLLMIFLVSFTRKQLTKIEQEQAKREQQEQVKREQQEQAKREQQEQAKREQQDEPDRRSDEDILGLSRGWTQEDLKVAYRRKCNQLHPDKWEKMPKQMQLMMEKEFKDVQQSYKNLSVK